VEKDGFELNFGELAGSDLSLVQQALKKIPGPSRLPILGNAHHLSGSNPSESFLQLAKHFGPIYRFHIFYTNVLVISDPALIRKIVEMKEGFQRLRFFDNDIKLLGRVLFAIDGKEWEEKRVLLNPHFRAQTVNNLLISISERSMSAIKYLEQFAKTDEAADVDMMFSRVTLDVISQFIFSSHLDSTSGKDNVLTKAFKHIVEGKEKLSIFPYWDYLPVPSRFAYLRAKRDFSNFVNEVIKSRRQQKVKSEKPADIVDALLASDLSDSDIQDEIMGLLFAGHDTTAHTLSYALYHICTDRDILMKVREEIDNVFQEKKEMTSIEQVGKLKYLTAVVKETLRIYPQGTAHPLTAVKDVDLDGLLVPKDTVVMCYTYVVHHLDKYWPDPEVFKPERFIANDIAIVDGVAAVDKQKTEGNTVESVKKASTYFPFMQGRHMCIGQHLAMLEMRVVLATLIKYFDFTVKPGYKVEPTQTFTLPPKGGMWLIPSIRS